MKHDLRHRADIEVLINAFYNKVRIDEVIGYIFNDVAQVDWPHHLPRMYDFWEHVIFQGGAYRGNPMAKHLQLNRQTPLTAAHFKRWLQLFSETLDELFEGENAELAKQRALSIGTMMQIKIAQAGNSTSLI